MAEPIGGAAMDWRDTRVLSFDCYGTLIDWETGIYHALAPLLAWSCTGLTRDGVLAAFLAREARQQAEAPAMLYAELLATVHRQLARDWGVAEDAAESRAFGDSVGDWLAFPDTPDALRYLKRHYRLVILSNVDCASFRRSNARLGVEFDAICTAQDIGSYKPDLRNFRYLLDRVAEWGVAPKQVLHVAQSLFHDHGPANQIGLSSVWIDRRNEASDWGSAAIRSPDGIRFDARFTSLAELAVAHRAATGG
jgi:2-haloacid dehalogenase